MKKSVLFSVLLALAVPAAAQPSGRILWNDGWTFTKDGESRQLDLPHDWGVEGAFCQEYPGESGKLAWWGEASYSKTLVLDTQQLRGTVLLEVDGAFSNSQVYVNGQKTGEWPYGYASWAVDLTARLTPGPNTVEIRLDNPPESSRWYPGGGIYRNVWLRFSAPVAVAHWGSFVTSTLAEGKAMVRQQLRFNAPQPTDARITTVIFRPDGTKVAEASDVAQISDGATVCQEFVIEHPALWSPENPQMYYAETSIDAEGAGDEVYLTPFGIREARFLPDGFYLNGQKTFLKGVCLHHDAGALGAKWSDDAWMRRLNMLKEMGCNAVRCSHNPPAPEFLDLCDRLGFLVIDEFTDTWTYPKKKNGYATLFDAWAEKDLTAMIHRDRNHPSVILWSIGNECGEQGDSTRWWIPRMLTDICHREDPTRQTSAGNDNPRAAGRGYAATIDVYGFNYKPHLYAEFVKTHPAQPVYGSETASCISTRGYYRFPVEQEKGRGWAMEAPYQVSSYDLYAPGWASKPDYEWQYEDVVSECAGEFVWTGYDYLGEPTPFNMDVSVLSNFHTEKEKEAYRKMVASWGQQISDEPLPSRSSYFGIIDLAGFPKDRYYLYQARWRPDKPMAHILPHWNWPGREGRVTPVHVYTSGDEAELFVNGKSMGRKAKEGYRIVWDDVVYESGEVEVVAYKNGLEWARDAVRTSGCPYKVELSADYVGEDLIYIYAQILDRDGVAVPDAGNLLEFTAQGGGTIIASDAGDPTSHVPFCSTSLPAFNGKASAIIERTSSAPISVKAVSTGLKTGKIRIQ